MGIYDTFINQIDVGKRIYGSITELAKAIDMPRDTLSRWYNRRHIPRMDEVAKFCDAMGMVLVHRDELHSPLDNIFVSIPVLKHKCVVNVGTIPDENIESWVKVDREFESVAGKTDLVVFKIDKPVDGLPTDSQVLVDRTNKEISYGKYYLVQMGLHLEVKRLGQARNGLIYYKDSDDNVCSLDNGKVIGRCIWIRCPI